MLKTTTLSNLMYQTPDKNTWIIAWGNSPVDVMYVSHLYPHVLFLPSQDIDDHQLSIFERLMADYAAPNISVKFMNSRLGQIIRCSNFPWNPPLIQDAVNIVNFVDNAIENKCTQLIIACEYGKSRSVATAHFIKDKYSITYINERSGNKRIRRLLDSV